MHQIVFNKISAAEISALPTLDQLTLIDAFKVDENSFKSGATDGKFGEVKRDGKKILRFRSQDYRIYFSIEGDEIEGKLHIHRILNANSLKDFLFRSKIGGSEDQRLSNSRSFWTLIEEGTNAPKH